VRDANTASQQERALQRAERAVYRAGRGERPEIGALLAARAAVFLDLRPGVAAGDQDIRERLVVPHGDVVARPQALDQVALEQQRLDLGVGRHDHERRGLGDHAAQALRQLGDGRIAGDALLEVARLADVEHVAGPVDHAVDAGAAGQQPELGAQHRDAGLERPTGGRRGGLFVDGCGRVVGHRGTLVPDVRAVNRGGRPVPQSRRAVPCRFRDIHRICE
jgi:hypothetical protein